MRLLVTQGEPFAVCASLPLSAMNCCKRVCVDAMQILLLSVSATWGEQCLHKTHHCHYYWLEAGLGGECCCYKLSASPKNMRAIKSRSKAGLLCFGVSLLQSRILCSQHFKQQDYGPYFDSLNYQILCLNLRPEGVASAL